MTVKLEGKIKELYLNNPTVHAALYPYVSGMGLSYTQCLELAVEALASRLDALKELWMEVR